MTASLLGWDTCSAVSIALVNEALARNRRGLVATFRHAGAGINLSGRFGPWSIGPDGSARLASVRMPIAEGWLSFAGGAAIDLAGIAIHAQMRLALMDAPDGSGRALAFDTDGAGSDGDRQAIVVTDVDDPEGRLGGFDGALLREALSECLSAHAPEAGHVIASVRARGTAAAPGLACPHDDWTFVDAGPGRQYLALLGSLGPPPSGEPRVDAALLADGAPAVFAVSDRLFAARALQPALAQGFRPRMPFEAKGASVGAKGRKSLGRQRFSLLKVEPFLRSVRAEVVEGGLKVVSHADASLPFSTRLDVLVTNRFAFRHDPASGRMRLSPKGQPEVRHTVTGKGLVGKTLGLLTKFVVLILSGPIDRSIASLAGALGAIANPAASPVRWTGTRDFHVSTATFGPLIRLADARPAPETPLKEAPVHEPA